MLRLSPNAPSGADDLKRVVLGAVAPQVACLRQDARLAVVAHAVSQAPDRQVGEGRAAILRCRLLPSIGVPCAKTCGARRNDRTALVRRQGLLAILARTFLHVESLDP